MKAGPTILLFVVSSTPLAADLACAPFCRDAACTDLNGNVGQECGSCDESHACRPGAPGFRRTTDPAPGRAEEPSAAQPSFADVSASAGLFDLAPDELPATAPNCLFDELWGETPIDKFLPGDRRRRDLFIRTDDGSFTDDVFESEQDRLEWVAEGGSDSLHEMMTDFGTMCQIERNAGGAAVEDFDGDGWPDVVLARVTSGVGAPTLLLNRGDGRFDDASEASGISAAWTAAGPMVAGRANGLAAFDCDNDGDADLFVSTIAGAQHFLLINDGRANFADEAAARGVAAIGHSGGADGACRVCMYTCIHTWVYMYACAHVCMCTACVHTTRAAPTVWMAHPQAPCTCTHMHAHARTCTRMHTHAHTCTHMHTC